MTPTEFREKHYKPVYIGDGLFAEFDGYHIILKTERSNEEHWIGIEPSVWNKLVEYREKIYEDAKTIEPG